MYCRNCGTELADDASFCYKCGTKTDRKRKNVYIAIILSFILTGIGTIYAGNTKKGLILFASRILASVIMIFIPILSILTILIWVFGIYDAYIETQKANGHSNPNLISEFKGWNSSTQLIAIVFMLVVLMISVYGVITILNPPSYTSSDSSSHSYYTTSPSSSSSGGSHYRGVDDSPSTIASRDPSWYYDHYEYGDNDKIDEYLESQGYD
jgi:TM2 domain-containing membrane protein YozV